jgi:hypothetical protein
MRDMGEGVRMNVPEGFKRCWRCKVTQPLSEFYKNRCKKSGLTDTCKKCSYELQHAKHMKGHVSGVQWFLAHKHNINPSQNRRRDACLTIKLHHEEMKDDPERLTTDFIQKITGRKCE